MPGFNMNSLNLFRRTWYLRRALHLNSSDKPFNVGCCSRNISTSDKSRDTATVKQESLSAETTIAKKNWMSFGYDIKDQEIDSTAAHATMFVSVTLCLVVGGFYFAYAPDYQLRDWSQREAYLELRHREQNGLPLIDPNYIDPSKIELPSDEELGDTEIII
ncbi:hypothetical protein J437_LFUL008249 [Ladona fulva]|uniref:NADH dehydrogenase [ubiquinone] 1 beta subcomplex subunit 11, mitochondrial n=1 Tax=Ladona fulva TaxID=123851 RepID=A0A8K0K8X6_LADFU|nr:hypothetical protein J437_LFUL008249 [Ladona fulva]